VTRRPLYGRRATPSRRGTHYFKLMINYMCNYNSNNGNGNNSDNEVASRLRRGTLLVMIVNYCLRTKTASGKKNERLCAQMMTPTLNVTVMRGTQTSLFPRNIPYVRALPRNGCIRSMNVEEVTRGMTMQQKCVCSLRKWE